MVIQTLTDLHQAFADDIDDTVPSPTGSTAALYAKRTRWFNRVREDMANRWFWKQLLKKDTLSISPASSIYPFASDFTRTNALYVFYTSDPISVFTNPYGDPEHTITITRDLTTGLYSVSFLIAPSQAGIATYYYFATPPPLVNPGDLVLLDGDAVIYGTLVRHHFAEGNFDEMDTAREEYENRVNELLNMQEIPTPGSLLDIRSFTRGLDEKQFYSGTTRRNA
jgi:hypothetical protein